MIYSWKLKKTHESQGANSLVLLRIILHPTLKITCNCDQNGVEDDYDCFHTGRQDIFIEEEIDCHANLLDQRQTKIVSHHRSLKNKILELLISLSTNADKLLCLRAF